MIEFRPPNNSEIENKKNEVLRMTDTAGSGQNPKLHCCMHSQTQRAGLQHLELSGALHLYPCTQYMAFEHLPQRGRKGCSINKKQRGGGRYLSGPPHLRFFQANDDINYSSFLSYTNNIQTNKPNKQTNPNSVTTGFCVDADFKGDFLKTQEEQSFCKQS